MAGDFEDLVEELLLASVCRTLCVEARKSFIGALLQFLDIELKLLDVWMLLVVGLNDEAQNVVEKMHTFCPVRTSLEDPTGVLTSFV